MTRLLFLKRRSFLTFSRCPRIPTSDQLWMAFCATFSVMTKEIDRFYYFCPITNIISQFHPLSYLTKLIKEKGELYKIFLFVCIRSVRYLVVKMAKAYHTAADLIGYLFLRWCCRKHYYAITLHFFLFRLKLKSVECAGI